MVVSGVRKAGSNVVVSGGGEAGSNVAVSGGGNAGSSVVVGGGGEYLNQETQSCLAAEGMSFQCTVGYAPQQNGYAERKNRTLMEAVRSLLSDASLPNTCWAEAVKHACYIGNRMINRKRNVSPLELFAGGRPNYQDLHQFGCDAYVMVPCEKGRKLDDRATKATFIGYDGMSKGYRITDRNSRRIIVSRDVVFFDTVTPPAIDVQFSEMSDEREAQDREGEKEDSVSDASSEEESEDEFYDAVEDVQKIKDGAVKQLNLGGRLAQMPESYQVASMIM